jgi:hypothetical protein
MTPELERQVVDALRRAEWWLGQMGFNRFGVLVKDDVPEVEPIRDEVRTALAAYDAAKKITPDLPQLGTWDVIECLKLWETARDGCLESMADLPEERPRFAPDLHGWLRFCMWASEEFAAKPDGT